MKIAVIGSGVIGYCTAISLLNEGREVVIYTKDDSQKNPTNTVSIVACALWQPYKLFSHLENEPKEIRDKIWDVSKESLKSFHSLVEEYGSEEIGVYQKMHYEYCNESIYLDRSLKPDFYYINLLEEFWSSQGIVNGIFAEQEIHTTNFIKSQNNSLPFKFIHGYKTYIIDSPKFLTFLERKFNQLGGELILREINPNTIKNLSEKVIFNCTGLNGFRVLNRKNINEFNHRQIVPKAGVLMLFKLKDDHVFPNTIVMDELTVLCRQNHLTIGTGEIKQGETELDLINRLQNYINLLINNPSYNNYGLEEFIEYHGINLEYPDEVLVGSRPYFKDGKGYHLNRTSLNRSKQKLSLYSNFGHGGSGVTLCWGTAKEIVNLYLEEVVSSLNSFNKFRANFQTNKYSIEFCHFDFKEVRQLSNHELNQKVKYEYNLLLDLVNKLRLKRSDYTLKVLIDNKEKRNDLNSHDRLLDCLTNYDIDFIAYEKELVDYMDQLEPHLPKGIKKEFNDYQINHQRLGCSQDIFLWYTIRFGIVDYSKEENIVKPISENAKIGERPFYGDSLITIIPTHLKKFEDLADDYIKKSFGYEIVSSIRRIYYQRNR